MNGHGHYRVEYPLRGTPKTFYPRAQEMSSSRAWHMSAIDAGFAHVPN